MPRIGNIGTSSAASIEEKEITKLFIKVKVINQGGTFHYLSDNNIKRIREKGSDQVHICAVLNHCLMAKSEHRCKLNSQAASSDK